MKRIFSALTAAVSVFLTNAVGAEGPSPPSPPSPPPAAVQPPAPAQGPLTVEEATADALSWGLDLSPSGRYLAAIRRKDDTDVVVVADLEDEKAKPYVHAVRHGRIQWVNWDSDDRLLFAVKFWSDRRGKVVPFATLKYKYLTAYEVRRLFAMDRDGKNKIMLFDGDDDALRTLNLTQVTDFLPDDPRHVLLPAWDNGVALFKVDTYTGEKQLIAEGGARTLSWFTDRDGNPAFRIDLGFWGNHVHIYARKGPMPADPDDLEWDKVYSVRLRDDENQTPPDFYPLYPGVEPSTYYVAARPEGEDTSGIHLYDFVAKKYVKTLATEPGVDIYDMFVDRHTREFLGVEYYADRKITRMANPVLQAHLTALDKYFGGEVDVYIEDYDRSQQTWLLWTVGPRDRGSWHVYRMKDRYVREVAHTQPVIDAGRLGTTRVLRYRARDGLEIMGYLTVPPGAPSAPPLIVLPHGGPERRDFFQFDELVQFLATRGYAVFQPNFRGSSGFGKKFADAGRRQWGAAMQDDLTDAVDFLVKNGHAAAGQACIVGGSYGGYAALAAATLTPDLFRCAVSIAGVSDLLEQLEADRKRLRRDDDQQIWDYLKRQIGDPKTDKAMLQARSPARLASAVKVPILLIHGTDDDKVPFEQAELMEEALRKHGKDVSLLKLQDAGHGFDDEDWQKALPGLLGFLEKHLPVAAVREQVAAP